MGVAEGEDPAVGRDEPVARSRGARHGGDDRLVEVEGAGRAEEMGVAEGEDAAVGRHQPVARAAGGADGGDDRLVEVDGPRRAEEMGVAEGEDAAVGRDEPVARGRDRRDVDAGRGSGDAVVGGIGAGDRIGHGHGAVRRRAARSQRHQDRLRHRPVAGVER